MEDYYNILGVARGADSDSIKQAYRRLAMKYHPDKTGGDKEAEKRLKEINQAYSVLGDEEKRAAYDQYGEAGLSGANGGFHPGGDFDDIFRNIGDIFGGRFGDIFGQGQDARRARGADLSYKIVIEFEEAYLGVEKTLDLPIKDICVKCKGSGAKNGTAFETCSTCDGSGVLRMQRGIFSMQQSCADCAGRGKRIKERCSSCQGRGTVDRVKRVAVKIPPGIQNDYRIRIRGQGDRRADGAGDLYVVVQVKSHPFFRAEGGHLICETPVNLVDATLGCKVPLPLPDAKLSLHVPAGTQSGDILRLRGKGMPDPHGRRRGDLLCRIQVETPVNLNAEQKKLLKELNLSLHRDVKRHSPRHDAWSERLKRFFHR